MLCVFLTCVCDDDDNFNISTTIAFIIDSIISIDFYPTMASYNNNNGDCDCDDEDGHECCCPYNRPMIIELFQRISMKEIHVPLTTIESNVMKMNGILSIIKLNRMFIDPAVINKDHDNNDDDCYDNNNSDYENFSLRLWPNSSSSPFSGNNHHHHYYDCLSTFITVYQHHHHYDNNSL